MDDDEQLAPPLLIMRRQIPVRVKLKCGHWGQVMMSRAEYDEWAITGMPLHVNTGEPEPCQRCIPLDKAEPRRHIPPDGSEHTPT